MGVGVQMGVGVVEPGNGNPWWVSDSCGEKESHSPGDGNVRWPAAGKPRRGHTCRWVAGFVDRASKQRVVSIGVGRQIVAASWFLYTA